MTGYRPWRQPGCEVNDEDGIVPSEGARPAVAGVPTGLDVLPVEDVGGTGDGCGRGLKLTKDATPRISRRNHSVDDCRAQDSETHSARNR